MRLIDADRLCEDLLNRWNIADTRKEELIRQVMADVVTPIVISQPTVNQWISVSERLPEIKEGHESDTVLCYTDMEAYAFSRFQENLFGQCGFECEREDGYYTSVGKVIAWMPLPKPYKEEEQ